MNNLYFSTPEEFWGKLTNEGKEISFKNSGAEPAIIWAYKNRSFLKQLGCVYTF